MITQANILELLMKAMPLPEKIGNIELNRTNCIRFNWMGTVYQISCDLDVSEVEGHILKGSNATMFLSKLLKLQNKK